MLMSGNIKYDGGDYSIGSRHIDDVQAEIDPGLTSAEPAWLIVNYGEGRNQIARLLIAPCAAFSLIGINESTTTSSNAGLSRVRHDSGAAALRFRSRAACTAPFE